MLSSLKNAALAAALGIATLTAATSAEARDRYYGRDRDNDAALAIGAGVVGLALGAAIASNRNDRYYGDRYYRGYPRGGYYYYYDRAPRHYYRDYPRYRNDWRGDRRGWGGRDWGRRGWGGRDRYYRRGW